MPRQLPENFVEALSSLSLAEHLLFTARVLRALRGELPPGAASVSSEFESEMERWLDERHFEQAMSILNDGENR